jgi:hypothetical protein
LSTGPVKAPTLKNVKVSGPPPYLADSRLRPTDKVIAAALGGFAAAPGRPATNIVWQGLSAIGKAVGLSRQSARLALRNLEFHGYIAIVPNGSIRTNQEYHLLWRQPGFAPATVNTPSPRDREAVRVASVKSRRPDGVRSPVCGNGRLGSYVDPYVPPSCKQYNSLAPEEKTSGSTLASVSAPSTPLAALPSADPQAPALLLALARKPGESPASRVDVSRAARALGRDLGDAAELGELYGRVASRIARGAVSPEVAIEAYHATRQSGARRPVAYFFAAVSRLSRPTDPRNAKRPVYAMS